MQAEPQLKLLSGARTVQVLNFICHAGTIYVLFILLCFARNEGSAPSTTMRMIVALYAFCTATTEVTRIKLQSARGSLLSIIPAMHAQSASFQSNITYADQNIIMLACVCI